MNFSIDSTGLTFPLSEFVSLYGGARFKKLKSHYTISNKNTITNTYIKTPIYKSLSFENSKDKRIMLPRFCYETFLSKNMVSDVSYDLVDGKDIVPEYLGRSTSNQKVVVDHMMNTVLPDQMSTLGFGGGILNLVAGCHSADTPITMYSGGSKPVQYVKVGDQLMGDDSTPRTVLQLASGVSEMYQISNRFGDKYTVTGDHILCLLGPDKSIVDTTVSWFNVESCVMQRYSFTTQTDAARFYSKIPSPCVVEISVKDYLKLPLSTAAQLVEYRNMIEYELRNVIMDPYRFASLTPQFIPECYKKNNSIVRLSLLCGFVDSIGHLQPNTYESYSGSNRKQSKMNGDSIYRLSFPIGKRRVAMDVCDIITSLGMICKIDTSDDGEYLYVYMTDEFHCISKSTISMVGSTSPIEVENVGESNYYGFLVSSNHRYMMCGNIITHNSGKTFVGMDLINRIKKKTLIVVPNTYLLEQWVSILEEYYPNNTIGCLYGKKKQDGDIVVSIINTACTLEEYDQRVSRGVYKKVCVNSMFREFGLVIFDEIHLYVSKEYRRVYERLSCKITIGLSATPTREDKLHRIAELSVGPIINADDLSGYVKNNVKFNADVRLVRYRCKPEYAEYKVRPDGILDYQSILNQILSDPDRNSMIIDRVIDLVKDTGSNVFVFSERRAHLEHLYDLLNERLLDVDLEDQISIDAPELEKNIILYGGVKKDTIEEAQSVSNIIFTSYAFSSVGVSITKMTGMILCTPRKKVESFTQIIGRIFRLSNAEQNAKPRYIYDIVDYKLPIKNGYRNRLDVYKTRDATVSFEDHYAM